MGKGLQTENAKDNIVLVDKPNLNTSQEVDDHTHALRHKLQGHLEALAAVQDGYSAKKREELVLQEKLSKLRLEKHEITIAVRKAKELIRQTEEEININVSLFHKLRKDGV